MNPSLRFLIATCAIVAIAVLVSSALVAFWAFSQAQEQLDRTVRSYDQLALATGIEAEIGRLLIAEINGIVDPRSPPLLRADPDRIENSVSTLIGRVGEEVAALAEGDERNKEREEFKSVYAIRALFSSMRHGIDRQRALVSRLDSGSAVRNFMNNVIAVDYRHLNRIVREVSADEKEEVRARLGDMVLLRERLMMASAITLSTVSVAVLLAAAFAYRLLMRPLRELGLGSTALASGDLSHRIREGGPPELSRLAHRFNDMAEQLSRQQSRLLAANDELEQTVEERTKQLQEKASRLAEIDRSRRLFFAKVSHELRTPLTVLLGEAEVALNQQSGSKGHNFEALSHIVASGNYLKRRIVDLLALARSEDGRLQLSLQALSLREVAAKIKSVSEAYAKSNEVQLTSTISIGEERCLADPERLQQGILAVLDNAIKFSPPGANVRFDVSSNDEGRSAVITVDDMGPGVPETDLSRLFDPYFQSETGRAQSGTGLGLAVAQWIALQHQGRINATNLRPNGLRVQVELPLLK